MKGKTLQAQLEVKNKEGCEQLEEAFNFLTKTQKKNYIKDKRSCSRCEFCKTKHCP